MREWEKSKSLVYYQKENKKNWARPLVKEQKPEEVNRIRSLSTFFLCSHFSQEHFDFLRKSSVRWAFSAKPTPLSTQESIKLPPTIWHRQTFAGLFDKSKEFLTNARNSTKFAATGHRCNQLQSLSLSKWEIYLNWLTGALAGVWFIPLSLRLVFLYKQRHLVFILKETMSSRR